MEVGQNLLAHIGCFVFSSLKHHEIPVLLTFTMGHNIKIPHYEKVLQIKEEKNIEKHLHVPAKKKKHKYL